MTDLLLRSGCANCAALCCVLLSFDHGFGGRIDDDCFGAAIGQAHPHIDFQRNAASWVNPHVMSVPLNPPLRAIDGGREEPSDDALMLLASAGDPLAFARLVTRYERRIVRFCGYLCRRAGRAEELAQEVFLRLWSARGRYVAEGRFEAYVFAIARNLCRRAALRARVEALFLPEPPEAVPPDDGERRELHGLTRAALLRVPPKLREALLLRFVEGLAYGDIARALATNESTARSRVHYGLKALAAEVKV